MTPLRVQRITCTLAQKKFQVLRSAKIKKTRFILSEITGGIPPDLDPEQLINSPFYAPEGMGEDWPLCMFATRGFAPLMRGYAPFPIFAFGGFTTFCSI